MHHQMCHVLVWKEEQCNWQLAVFLSYLDQGSSNDLNIIPTILSIFTQNSLMNKLLRLCRMLVDDPFDHNCAIRSMIGSIAVTRLIYSC
jgi:hypothetical protein